MKLTRILHKQDIGWHFKKFWYGSGKRKIANDKAQQILEEKGIPVFSPSDILYEKREFERVEVVGYKPAPVRLDKTHPNWHDTPLLTYRDNNVLLEGLTQAKVLTKCIEIEQGLPQTYSLNSTKAIDKRIKDIILSTHVFDAEQKKLPKLKDPNRPAWNFPRVYGITQDRVNKLLVTNLLQLIESVSPLSIVKHRYVLDDALFRYNFERFDELIQFELKAETFITSSKPLAPISKESTDNSVLPDLFPIKPTITLTPENIYQLQTTYPVKMAMPKPHPHTIIFYHNEQEVANIFEEPVTEPQIFGRSLLKTFTAAASYAKAKFGDNIQELPQPVTVQCIQTNGKLFHFGVLQLNTLDLENGNTKNVWYQTGRIPLFDTCCYKVGKPVLEGYNNDVVKYLKAFYNNV